MAELPADATTKTCAHRKRVVRVSGRPPIAHIRLLILWLRRAAPRRGALATGNPLTPGVVARASYDLPGAFAFSSASSSVR